MKKLIEIMILVLIMMDKKCCI